MSQNKKIIVPAGHNLITRRDFLSHGLIAGTGIVMAPTFLELLSRRAYGQSQGCTFSAGGSGKTPFLCVDLSGGGNIAGSNVLVGAQGGQTDFLQTYVPLGRPATDHPNVSGIDTSMGLAFHPNSGFLNGINTVLETLGTTTANQIKSRVDGAIACAISGDDTNTNPLNPVYWISKIHEGSLIKIAGSSTRSSGGNSTVPPESYSALSRAVRISNPGEATNLASLGALATNLDKDRALQILKAANSTSASMLQTFNERELPSQIREIASCGYLNSAEMPIRFTEQNLDPRLDPVFVGASSAFAPDLNTFNAGNNANLRRLATLMKVLLDGYSGSAVHEMGGYDYHGNTRQDQHRRDFEAGQAIGRALAAAFQKGSNLFVYLYTDGGLSSDGAVNTVQNFDVNGNVTGAAYEANQFVNDAGQTGAAVIMAYIHNTPRTSRAYIRNEKRQVGWFRSLNGRVGVDPASSVLADNVTNVAQWVVLNYLALHGEEGQLESITGSNPFAADMSKYLNFQKVA